MIARFIKEQKRYTLNELTTLYDVTEQRMISVLKRLRSIGVLKIVSNTENQVSRTDLLDGEDLINDEQLGNKNYLYVFKFVGIIVVADIIFKCYPKYIFSAIIEKPFIKVLKVLKKYNSDSQKIPHFNDFNLDEPYNPLATTLYLIRDFYEYGLYQKEELIYETNGEGAIHWEKTINETFMIMENNRPYYPELITKKKQLDSLDYFRRLHRYIVTQCSLELEVAGLLEYFELLPVYESYEAFEDFGDTNYILNQLEKEINIQFNTRLQFVLKLMYIYIYKHNSFDFDFEIGIYGTSHFHTIWEKVCQEVFDNQLEKPLANLKLPKVLNVDKYSPDDTLLSIIEKPLWKNKSSLGKEAYASGTFIPDCIVLNKSGGISSFEIIDAKYYTPRFNESGKIIGQPGIGDVSKQFLYQMVYDEFVKEHNISIINNYFVMPTESAEENSLFVSMNLFEKIGLREIQVIFADANVLYEAYLIGEKLLLKN
ncbi:LlaJI family restriction endonuclease [Hutsoniella sourekii]|uniref:LlaJI family restriction endonuclease n=1 Tax=Hutsoniella sourekii TaxID=87650 RepID=UPI000484FCB7|nr:LlaJI family restriction endonuclease [Hutsoniella sourekii]